ncbi:MAG: hypothetical protein ACK5TO_16905 [Planctomycetaceae bacterium]
MVEFLVGQIPKLMTSGDFQRFQLPETSLILVVRFAWMLIWDPSVTYLGGSPKSFTDFSGTLSALTHRITEMTDFVFPGRVRTRQPPRPTRRRVKTIRLHFHLCSSIDRWITSSTAQLIESRPLKISINDNGLSATLSNTPWIPAMS